MSTRKIKRVIIALLAVTMLVVSSAFVASALETRWVHYDVGDAYFSAKMGSAFNGSIVTSSQLYLSGGTGVTGTTNTRNQYASAYGYLSSLSRYGVNVPVSYSNIAIQQYYSTALSTTKWFTYSTGNLFLTTQEEV